MMYSEDSQIIKISRLYYMEDMSQKEIARRMQISVATVSRAIQKARKLGYVDIRITDPSEGYQKLEIEIEKTYGLDECAIAETAVKREHTLSNIAVKLEHLLRRILAKGDLLGVSWGETLKGLADAIGDLSDIGADTVPIIGAMGQVETGIYPNAVASEYASKLGGKSYLVNVPTILDSSELRDSILNDSGFRPVAKLWARVKTALLSVSSVDEKASVYRYGIFKKEDLADLKKRNVSCATNFNFLDKEGNKIIAPVTDRLINMSLEDLSKIENLVIIAVGKEKVVPIRSVLRSGICRILLTDEETARRL